MSVGKSTPLLHNHGGWGLGGVLILTPTGDRGVVVTVCTGECTGVPRSLLHGTFVKRLYERGPRSLLHAQKPRGFSRVFHVRYYIGHLSNDPTFVRHVHYYINGGIERGLRSNDASCSPHVRGLGIERGTSVEQAVTQACSNGTSLFHHSFYMPPLLVCTVSRDPPCLGASVGGLCSNERGPRSCLRLLNVQCSNERGKHGGLTARGMPHVVMISRGGGA
jgi:hypothetical protein